MRVSIFYLTLHHLGNINQILKNLSNSMAIKCSPVAIPSVDIDDEGKFKYILIKLKNKSEKKSRFIVRGYKWATFHAGIFDKLEKELKAAGYDCKCVGGGRIQHNPKEKKIFVYGHSWCYGRANHSCTVSLLQEKYPDYVSISFSNEGY